MLSYATIIYATVRCDLCGMFAQDTYGDSFEHILYRLEEEGWVFNTATGYAKCYHCVGNKEESE